MSNFHDSIHTRTCARSGGAVRVVFRRHEGCKDHLGQTLAWSPVSQFWVCAGKKAHLGARAFPGGEGRQLLSSFGVHTSARQVRNQGVGLHTEHQSASEVGARGKRMDQVERIWMCCHVGPSGVLPPPRSGLLGPPGPSEGLRRLSPPGRSSFGRRPSLDRLLPAGVRD
ncbi:unnamed protein product [Tetraodon nigroviridis]|uniref:(spotted green pufferfish) hypothetical protein n=1 Tax=Tetraodon nigroviridis TaxID=99883 RepID=Q4RTR0_TETNG|nr:unnamed protein product [Tetraodon nigroviridis]